MLVVRQRAMKAIEAARELDAFMVQEAKERQATAAMHLIKCPD
jgi:hypothetical protein